MLKMNLQSFGHLIQRADSLEKTLMLGQIEGRRRRGQQRDEMVGWYHRLNGLEFEQAPGDSEGQESQACFSPWGCKESDTTEPLNNNKVISFTCHDSITLGTSFSSFYTIFLLPELLIDMYCNSENCFLAKTQIASIKYPFDKFLRIEFDLCDKPANPRFHQNQ